MNDKRMAAVLAVMACSIIFAGLVWANSASGQEDEMTEEEHEETEEQTSTVVRDSLLFTGPKTFFAGDFVHLYDATPYMIMNGHVAAKLPCDDNSEPQFQILIGQAPELEVADLHTIDELSDPGNMCMYHVDLHSAHEDHEGTADGMPITDIAIINPTDDRLRFPSTASVVIGVNEIMPLEDHGHEEEEHEEEEHGEEEEHEE